MTIKPADRAEIPKLRELWTEAFGDPREFLDSFFSEAFSPERSLCLWQGDELLAACYWFDCLCHGEPCAYIYAVATAKPHRGRGHAHGLMDALHDLLKRRGYAIVVLVPGSEALFRFYAGMGYRGFSPVKELVCTAGTEAARLRPVSREEYAALRRRLLPAGGVIQERENLAFLQTHARLYAGDDLLLAARVEGDRLFAPELLGSAVAAPGIVKAFGCKTGTFRISGGERCFAMYRPLIPAAAPEYFSLAFD